MDSIRIIIIALISLAIVATSVSVGAAAYKVGLPLSPGICQQQSDGSLHGFAVEVWQQIAIRSAVKYEFETCDSVPQCSAKFYSGGLDILLLGIPATRETLKTAVFSRPYFISGLRILAIDKPKNHLLTDIRALSAIYSPIVAQSALVFILMIFIFGNLLWLMERKDDALISSSYRNGIFDAMWCVLSIKTTIGFGDVVPKQHHARLLSVLIWLIGLLLINLITAEIVSEFSANKVKSSIVGLDSLRGRKIATLDDKIAILELKKIGAVVVVNPTIEAAYEELKTRKVDAIALYSGIVSTYAKRAAQDGLLVRVIPGRYDNRYVSIAIRRNTMRKDPALLSKVNRALNDMHEDSYILFLKSKWLEVQDS
ncbi:MAG: transporter substrate-binding domain-containing protein [Nitrospirae bacterium]|nr:transporter substrate-binding domain-containing protein [Nitrospirota bacterium]